MSQLTISLFGPFQVTLDGKPVTGFESAKVRALLAFLAAQAHSVHRRETLAELLWPDHPPGAALADLRHALANLRKAIADASTEPPFLLITQTTLQFNLASDAAVDVIDFLSFWADGEPANTDACRAALALRRGPFLDGFRLSGSPQFEEWQVVMTEQMDHLAVQALTHLIHDAVARGDFVQASDWTRRQLVLQPWNEEAHQQLIWQLACSGQYAAALHHYDVCRRLLAAELGVEPQPATQALVERIRRSDRLIDPVTCAEDEPPPSRAKHHLPAPPPLFLGRAAELSQIAAYLTDPDCRLLTILGPGGMGKTLLAIEAARAQSDHFGDGVCFVDLTAVTQPDLIGNAILRALALPTTPQTAGQRLFSYLRERQILLLLDNFEHLLSGTDLLIGLLQAAPRLKLLVTSRARLHLQEEWLFPLEGLATPSDAVLRPLADSPNAGAPRGLADFASLRLFIKRADHLLPGFRPTAADLSQIAEICCLLEGMPLAIELAAGWTRTLSLAEITEAVRSRLDLLTTSLRDLPSRHRSMHAVFEHSWRLLTARERSLLCQLSVFRGGFTASAATAVTDASLTELQSLVDHSWLRVQAGRFTLHELMRQYCAEKLNHEPLAEMSDPTEEVHRRHVAYFAAITGAKEATLNWQCESMSLLKPDYANLEAAWHWALAHDDLSAARQMMNSLYYVADMTGWFGAMLPFFEYATTMLRQRRQEEKLSPAQRQAITLLHSNILYIQLALYQRLGWLTRAEASLEEMKAALAGAEKDALWQDQSFIARWATTCLAFARGDFAAAQVAAQTELAFLQTHDLYCYPWRAEIGTRFWQAHVMATLAAISACLGEYPTALSYYQQAISLRDDMGEQRYKATNLRAMAGVLRLAGDYEQALSVACSALALSRSFDDRLSAAYTELTVAQIETDNGRYNVAMERCKHSLAVGQESGEHALLMRSLIEMARIELALEHPGAARHWLEEAIAAFVQMGEAHSNHLASIYLGLGRVAAAEGDWSRSRQMLRQALTYPGRSAWETRAILAVMDEVDASGESSTLAGMTLQRRLSD